MASEEKSMDPESHEPEIQEDDSIDIEAEETEEILEELDPIELLNAQLNNKEEELAEQRKAYQLLQADTENFKKRLRKEKEDSVQYANEKLIKELLHIHDNMERALAVDNPTVESLKEGLNMIVKQFYTFLEKEKIELIEAIGNKFDPYLHEVLTQIESEKHDEDTVIQEYRKGYILKGRVMRAAQVVTSKRPAGSVSPKDESQQESADQESVEPEEQEE